jgi:pyruvate/2-oxoacid:ferredoxin oxidoreductase alpha subunit
MESAARVIREVEAEFKQHFGRSYGGLVDTYRVEVAEVLLLTAGGVTGTARVAVDLARDRGERVGLLKLRSMRPFPRRELGALLADCKAVGVIDRSVCFGWSAGPLFVETLGALGSTAVRPKMLNFIDGLGGADITIEHIDWAISRTLDAARGADVPEVNWPAFAEEEQIAIQSGAKSYVSGSAVN